MTILKDTEYLREQSEMKVIHDLSHTRVRDAYNVKWEGTDLESNLRRVEGDESVQEIEGYLGGRTDLKILDVGCGMGRTVEYFSNKGYDVTGIDLASTGLQAYRDIRPNADLVCGSADSLPFAPKSFDLIMLMGVLYEIESVDDIIDMLSNMTNVLKPGGRLIYVCQYPKDLWKTILSHVPFEKRWFRFLFMRNKYHAVPHFGRWVISNHETIKLFTQSGWKLETLKPLNHYYGAANWFYDIFYKRRNIEPLAFAVEKNPETSIRLPGRVVAKFSKRFCPMLCPGLVYLQMKVKD